MGTLEGGDERQARCELRSEEGQSVGTGGEGGAEDCGARAPGCAVTSFPEMQRSKGRLSDRIVHKRYKSSAKALPALLSSSPSPIYFYNHKFPFNLHSLRPPCQTPQKERKMTNPEVTCRIKVCAAETQLLLPEGTGRAPAPHPDTGVRAGDAGRGRPVPLACRPSVWGQTASPKTCQSTVPWLISRSQHSGGSCETTSSRARLQAQDGPSADLASYLKESPVSPVPPAALLVPVASHR